MLDVTKRKYFDIVFLPFFELKEKSPLLTMFIINWIIQMIDVKYRIM